MVRVGGLTYTIDPGRAWASASATCASRASRSSAGEDLQGGRLGAGGRGSQAAGGEPVWDVVARYLRAQKTVRPRSSTCRRSSASRATRVSPELLCGASSDAPHQRTATSERRGGVLVAIRRNLSRSHLGLRREQQGDRGCRYGHARRLFQEASARARPGRLLAGRGSELFFHLSPSMEPELAARLPKQEGCRDRRSGRKVFGYNELSPLCALPPRAV